MLFFKDYILNTHPYKGGSTRTDTGIKETVTKDTRELHKNVIKRNPLGASPKAIEAIYNNLHQVSEYGFQDDHVFTKKLSDFFEGALLPSSFCRPTAGWNCWI